MSQLAASPPEVTQNRGSTIIAVFTVTFSIAILLLAVRLYIRARILKSVWLDDLFIFIGVIITIAPSTLILLAVDAGLGRHRETLSIGQVSRIVEFQTLAQFFVALSLMFTRLSICLLLLRFTALQKWFPRTIYCIMGIMAIVNISFAVLNLTSCNPTQKIWFHTMAGTCWTRAVQESVAIFNGVISVLCDFTLAVLPTFYLWNVQMGRELKIGICCLLSVGIVPGICAIFRSALHRRVFTVDFTWNIVDVVLWSLLENNILIIAACIPTLKPLKKIITSSLQSLRAHFSRNNESFDQIGGVHHLTTLQPLHDPRQGRKVPQSLMGNRAEVQGPERYPLSKSDRSSLSRLNLNGIETQKDFYVTDEERDLGL